MSTQRFRGGSDDPPGPTRQDLVRAQWAIFDNQLAEAADAHPGVESEEFLAVHAAYYALEAHVPWWRQVGVWQQAYRSYPHRTELDKVSQ